MIEALAVLMKEKVVIEACPDEVLYLAFRDLSFEEAMHRFLTMRGYDIVKKDGGIYHVIKRGEVGPNQRPEANAGTEYVSPTTPGPGVAHP